MKAKIPSAKKTLMGCVCVELCVFGLVSQKLISDSAYPNEVNIYLGLNIHRQIAHIRDSFFELLD